MAFFVVLHDSAPYSSTDLTLELNSLIFVRIDTTLELHNYVLRLQVCSPPLADSCSDVCVCATLLVDDATQICKGFHLFQLASMYCDWVLAFRVDLQDLGLALMALETSL